MHIAHKQCSLLYCTLFISVSLLPQGIRSNGYNSFRTLLRGERGSVLQHVIRERSQMEPRLVGVAQPCSTGHSYHGLSTVDTDTEQPHSSSTKVSGDMKR